MSNTGIIPLDQLPEGGSPGVTDTSGVSGVSGNGIIPLHQLPDNPPSGDTFAPQPGYEPEGGLGEWARKNLEAGGATPDWQGRVMAGGVMGAGRTGATLLDILSDPLTKTEQVVTPGSVADKALQAMKGGTIEKIAQRMQKTADWLKTGSHPEGFWENVGSLGEQALEYMLPSALAKIAGPAVTAAKATEGAGATARAVENLKGSQEVANILIKHPKLAGLVAIGLEQGSIQAGQTYLHTEDPRQAAVAGAVGGALGTGFAATPEAMRLVAKSPLGGWIKDVAPKSANIFDTSIPVLHDQLTGGGWTTEAGAVGYPEFAEAQQTGAGEALGKMSQQATEKAVENINAIPAFKAEIPQLPGEYGEVKAVTPRPVGSEGPPAVSEKPVIAEKLKPAYTFESNNPAEARQMRSELEDQMNTPEFKRLPAARQQAVRDAAQALDHQLSISQISGPHEFEIARPTDSLRTPGQAAAQLEASAASGFRKLDDVSNGEFSRLRNLISKNMSTLANPGISDEVAQTATDNINQANRDMNDLFDQYAGRSEMSGQDYARIKTAWRYSKVLNNLHARMERMTNGITVEETARGGQRVMTGNTRALSNWLEAPNELGYRTNREDVEELIGREGVDNIKKLTNLLSKADTARATNGVIRNVAGQLSRDIKKGAIVGGVLGKILGPGWAVGAGVGGVSGAGITGMRALLKYAMTHPQMGEMVTFAAENNVAPQIYAPLLSRMIMEPLQHLPGEKDQSGAKPTELSPETKQQEEQLLKEFK